MSPSDKVESGRRGIGLKNGPSGLELRVPELMLTYRQRRRTDFASGLCFAIELKLTNHSIEVGSEFSQVLQRSDGFF